MMTLSKETLAIQREPDVIYFRNKAKEYAVKIGMSMVGQTKLITAASELVRNMLRYANGGNAILEIVIRNNVKGVRLTFTDKGPGIKDVKQAMQDGFSTGRSLGLGLPGAKRLSNEFDIKSEVGKGTTVTIIRWKNGL
ncbi:anti-sigma regulatory factor [Adhaeribacter aerolatus]|uniref:Anti-sigma regulatory factor n=1 Tax=Adhaeribacter aerolatus TaxID=670289 RepID=A0A512ATY9_9BACT|nr:anti-sigma regulatory factor [Adhaeribacter aerolatus]GEO03181.1 anti-sigma regulatory factor [Adhaeribacter aerolatus]